MQSDASCTRFLNTARYFLNPNPTGRMVSVIGYIQFKQTVFRIMLLQLTSLNQHGYMKNLRSMNCHSAFLKFSYDGLLVPCQYVYLQLMLLGSYSQGTRWCWEFPCQWYTVTKHVQWLCEENLGGRTQDIRADKNDRRNTSANAYRTAPHLEAA